MWNQQTKLTLIFITLQFGARLPLSLFLSLSLMLKHHFVKLQYNFEK